MVDRRGHKSIQRHVEGVPGPAAIEPPPARAGNRSGRPGRIGGAALDVLEDEYDKDYSRSVADHPLVEYARNHDNLLLTPHIAGSTRSAWLLTRMHTIEMVIKYFENE